MASTECTAYCISVSLFNKKKLSAFVDNTVVHVDLTKLYLTSLQNYLHLQFDYTPIRQTGFEEAL